MRLHFTADIPRSYLKVCPAPALNFRGGAIIKVSQSDFMLRSNRIRLFMEKKVGLSVNVLDFLPEVLKKYLNVSRIIFYDDNFHLQ